MTKKEWEGAPMTILLLTPSFHCLLDGHVWSYNHQNMYEVETLFLG